MASQKDRLLEMCHKIIPEYHPIKSLLYLAEDEHASIGEQITCHKEVLKYVESSLSSVAVTGDIGFDLNAVNITIDSVDANLSLENNDEPESMPIDVSIDTIEIDN